MGQPCFARVSLRPVLRSAPPLAAARGGGPGRHRLAGNNGKAAAAIRRLGSTEAYFIPCLCPGVSSAPQATMQLTLTWRVARALNPRTVHFGRILRDVITPEAWDGKGMKLLRVVVMVSLLPSIRGWACSPPAHHRAQPSVRGPAAVSARSSAPSYPQGSCRSRPHTDLQQAARTCHPPCEEVPPRSSLEISSAAHPPPSAALSGHGISQRAMAPCVPGKPAGPRLLHLSL